MSTFSFGQIKKKTPYWTTMIEAIYIAVNITTKENSGVRNKKWTRILRQPLVTLMVHYV